MQPKNKLRQHFQDLRRHLSQNQQVAAAADVLVQLIDSGLLEHQQFACYLAQDNELNMAPIINYLWKKDKVVTIPVITHGYENNLLVFKKYMTKTQLVLNQYQIFEPENTEIVALHHLDVIFVPLVAFDRRGVRLGMGGGFYDRTFSNIRGKNRDEKPLLVGVGHACQEAKQLICDQWDVKLDVVVTDQGFVGDYELFSV